MKTDAELLEYLRNRKDYLLSVLASEPKDSSEWQGCSEELRYLNWALLGAKNATVDRKADLS